MNGFYEIIQKRDRRENPASNSNHIPNLSTNYIKLLGGEMIDIQDYEPDASTSHKEYYYNSRLNILCKRIWKVKNKLAYWQPISL